MAGVANYDENNVYTEITPPLGADLKNILVCCRKTPA